ncbi:MAG TPA: GNAT family N-acetyltransferase [Nocardioidaceae bacterium]|nr:GNAT family N-acetyltransferase [Nocardioidaceae bacterium]
MQIERFTPDDHDTTVAAVELTNAAFKVDAPYEHPFTVAAYAAMRRYGWDGEAPETFAAWEHDRLAGVVALHTSEWDNTHLAWLEVLVHPDLRGAGRGSEMLAFAENRAREIGRTSIGLDGWDCAETHRFAAKHDVPRKGSAIKRRQVLEHVDRDLVEETYVDAAGAASDYELVRLLGRVPDDLVDAVAEMSASINDAPTDDLDIEDEVYPVERIRGYETAMENRGKRLYRVLARHRGTGELAGHTVVAVDSERPWIGDQHDTTVVAAHRGHRLGLLLKTDMLRWLAQTEPGLATIDTWNMESNGFMIAVNERLGYEVLGRELEFQRDAR